MKYSTFCWHYEDLMLYSVNYNHWGKPKLWYGVPEDHRERFEKAARQKNFLLFKKDPNILHDINTMIYPGYLQQQKVSLSLFTFSGQSVQDAPDARGVHPHLPRVLPCGLLDRDQRG